MLSYKINKYLFPYITKKHLNACHIVFLLFLFLHIAAFPPCAALALDDEYLLELENDKGTTLFSERLKNDDGFAIRFIHSVAKTPVTDYFIVRDGKIVLDKTIYHDFGAGLPHNPEKGQKMKSEHGEISITGFNRTIPELALRVGRVAEHTLLLFDEAHSRQGVKETRAIPLATLARPGSVILFKILKAR